MSINKGARIYNLFPSLVGSMEKWKKHILRAQKMGFNWVYINPFHYPGFSGSLYSPKDYYAFNPLFINSQDDRDPLDQLKDVVSYAKNLNIRLMMDLVINHTAIDHPNTEEHPNWYKTDENGEIVRPSVISEGRKIVWGDLAQIDNEHSADRGNLWNYWWDLTDFYLNLGFDGFRCDAAYKVTADLWRFLISRSKENYPHCVFFAETLGCELKDIIRMAKSGFDYTFNSVKWWDYEADWCIKQYMENSKYSKSVSFPETHDTPRLAEEVDSDKKQLKRSYLFCSLFSTGVMIPIGFEYGFVKKLDVVKTKPSDWEEESINLSAFIKRANSLKTTYKIFNEDNEIRILDIGNTSVLGIVKISHSRQERVLILVNKDKERYQEIVIDSIYDLLDTEEPIKDISLDMVMDYIPDKFEYHLKPCQIKILYIAEK